MTTAKEARQVLSAFAPRDIDSAAEYALDLDAFAAAVERETLQDGERADVEARIRADEREKIATWLDEQGDHARQHETRGQGYTAPSNALYQMARRLRMGEP